MRSHVTLLLAAAVLLVGLSAGGNSSPGCIPVEPLEPVCEAPSDCTWCMYRTLVTSPDDCECALCNEAVPMNAAVCRERADAYLRHCGHLDCPQIVCEQPPPLTCADGECVPASQECGDPDVRARYEACTAATDESTCLAAGGDWTRVGLSPEPVCQCPTGQGDCPCDGPDDCLSACTAPMEDMDWSCERAVGHCSPVSLTVGCRCFFFQEGQAEGICAD